VVDDLTAAAAPLGPEGLEGPRVVVERRGLRPDRGFPEPVGVRLRRDVAAREPELEARLLGLDEGQVQLDGGPLGELGAVVLDEEHRRCPVPVASAGDVRREARPLELLQRRDVRRRPAPLRRRRLGRDPAGEAQAVEDPFRFPSWWRVLDGEAGEVPAQRLIEVEGEEGAPVSSVGREREAVSRRPCRARCAHRPAAASAARNSAGSVTGAWHAKLSQT
jgi:hypothetical protein